MLFISPKKTPLSRTNIHKKCAQCIPRVLQGLVWKLSIPICRCAGVWRTWRGTTTSTGTWPPGTVSSELRTLSRLTFYNVFLLGVTRISDRISGRIYGYQKAGYPPATIKRLYEVVFLWGKCRIFIIFLKVNSLVRFPTG